MIKDGAGITYSDPAGGTLEALGRAPRRSRARAGVHADGSQTARDGLANLVGELAATIERAQELPAKVSDAQRLRYRLLLRQVEIERKVHALESEAALARQSGQEFTTRRLLAQARALVEEQTDTTAMIGEVEHVLQRLRRERRSLLYRLDCGESLVAAFPPGPIQDNLHAMLEDARQCLVLRRLTTGATDA